MFQDYDNSLSSAACSQLDACLMYDSFYGARACTQAFSDVLISHTPSGENKCFSLPLAQGVIVSLSHDSTDTILLHGHHVGKLVKACLVNSLGI